MLWCLLTTAIATPGDSTSSPPDETEQAAPVPVDDVEPGEAADDSQNVAPTPADTTAPPDTATDESTSPGDSPGDEDAKAASTSPDVTSTTGVDDPSDTSEKASNVELRSRWPLVKVKVGESLERQLVDPDPNGSSSFEVQRGPPGLTVERSGRLTYTPSAEDAGVWSVSIEVRSGGKRPKFMGFVLDVAAESKPANAHTGTTPFRVSPKSDPGWFSVRECFVSLGLQGGFSENKRDAWATIGLPVVAASASPAVAVSCGGGGEKFRWFLGADSAPGYFHLGRPGRLNHVLGGTLGVERSWKKTKLGVFGTGGILTYAVGVRGMWLPIRGPRGERHGFVMKVFGHPPRLAGGAMVAYTMEFGRF